MKTRPLTGNRWRFLREDLGATTQSILADVTGELSEAHARTIAHLLADDIRGKVLIVPPGRRDPLSNPTLVHHGARAAGWHLLRADNNDALADLYVVSSALARRIAHAIADATGERVKLLDNLSQPKYLSEHPAQTIAGRRRNPREGTNRDFAIATIRKALKQRSGKAWSVTGGRGTSWGWIKIKSPPARSTWGHRLKPGLPDYPENYEEYDSGKPGHNMGPAERQELAALLGLDVVHHQGESIPAGHDYYDEYMDRAQGRTPERVGVPYWDNPGREPSRVRERGTRVTAPASPEERIAALRQIVEEKQYAKIDGQMVDLFSASAIISVYDALNDANKAKYAAMPAPKMATVAFKLLKPKPNPAGDPQPGESWSKLGGGRVRISHAIGGRVKFVDLDTGNPEWMPRDEFSHLYRFKPRTPLRPSANPRALFERFEINMPAQAVRDLAGPGPADEAAGYWATRIKRPAAITPALLAAELKEHGAWDAEELADDAANWQRAIWIGAGNLREESRGNTPNPKGKMSAADFAELSAAVLAVIAARPGAAEQYRGRGLSDMRFRWDMLHASGFPTTRLYSYLNDNHIDTALRHIVGGGRTVGNPGERHEAWDVYLNGKLIDTVFATGYDAEEMRRSLINHDNYDPRITVRKQPKGRNPRVHPPAGAYPGMKIGRSVRFSKAEIQAFKRRWPASGLPERGVQFDFATNGDLVDIHPSGWGEDSDGGAVNALVDDAKTLLVKKGIVPAWAAPNPRELSVFDKHALKIARDTLKMNDAFARIMGGPTKEEARETIHRLTGKWPKENPRLPDNVEAIKAVGGGWILLVNGFQWGRGEPDRSGAYSETFPTKAEAIAAFLEGRTNPRSPFKWDTYAGGIGAWEGAHSYTAQTPYGKYSVSPFTTRYGRRAGYIVGFAHHSGDYTGAHRALPIPAGIPGSGGGLHHQLGTARSPNAGKRIAREHHESILAASGPTQNPGGSVRARAERTFRKWHEFGSEKVTRMKGPDRLIPKTLVKLGDLESVTYRSPKWTGSETLYEHKTKRPRPVLATDPDGRHVFIVGGNMKVTADGLVN